MVPMTDDLAQLRERLAAKVIGANQIASEPVAAALREVPRHLFLPDLPPESAYRDDAIVTKRDAQGIPVSSSSQPAIMAVMLDQLDLAPGHRVLEIGAGTGYNAALIRHIVGDSGSVVTVDIDRDLTEAAREHLASAGYADVTVACADGADGWPDGAPYDRVIATVGVSDLAPAWVAQAVPFDARIVVPLDVRGMQLAVAFTRTGGTLAHWTSSALAPCGFMRMRGSLAGPERVIVLQPGLTVTVPGPGAPDIEPVALAAALAGSPAQVPTGVRAASARVYWGLGLWLAAGAARSCRVDEYQPAESESARLGRAPLRARAIVTTVGILGSGGIALLTADPSQQPELALEASGFGPDGPALAAELAAHIRAWDAAGQPGTAGLRIDAYPAAPSAPGAAPPAPAAGALLVERPCTTFVVHRTRA
jgi:protein-L-isoaspartate(D-aspartate) O-methyltransferase